MAVKSKDYFNELKNRHELEESLSVEELEKRSLSVNPNILEASNKTEEAKKYVQMLGAAFDSYVVSWLKPDDYKENEISRREYEFSMKTSIYNFLELFEGFVKLKFQEDPKNAGKERKAREGLSVNDLKMVLANQARKYGTVSDVWVENIKNGTYDMEQIKKVTDAVYNWAQTHDNSETEKPSFETTAHAYEAMQKIVASRSRLWRFWIWNWNQDRKEQEYLKALEAQVKEINEKFDNVVANVIAQEKETPCVKAYGDFLDAEIKNDMLEDRAERIESFEAELKDKIEDEKREFERQKKELLQEQLESEKLRKEEEERIAKEQERQAKIESGLTLEVKFEDVTTAENFKAEMLDELIKELPENALTVGLRKDFLGKAFDNVLMKTVKEELAKFTENVDKQAQMHEMAKAIFTSACSAAYSAGYIMDPITRLAAAQIITDKIMSKLSPAALEPDKYTAVEKGYFLAHPVTANAVLTQQLKVGEAFVNETYEKANKIYGEMTGNVQEIQEFLEVQQPKAQPEPQSQQEPEEELIGYDEREDRYYDINEDNGAVYFEYEVEGKSSEIVVPDLSNAFEVGDESSYAVHEEVVEENEELAAEEEQPEPEQEKEVPVFEKLAEVINQENFKENLVDGLAQKLPSGITLKHEDKNIEEMKTYFFKRSASCLQGLSAKINGLNKKFEAGLEEGKEAKALMQEYVKGLAGEAQILAGAMTIKSTAYRHVLTQLTVDYLVQNYSPAVHMKDLQEFKQGALFSNEALLKAAFGNNQTAIDKAKEEYGKLMEAEVAVVPNGNNEKEHVFGENNPFVEGGANKSAPISQQSKQNIPTMNDNKIFQK